ncbi:hypothetical protein [Bacteroides sp. 51]|uniref:hypothetical protein n=1 Tax=Bacteroides sp. 51 TaxID=2302938 RepID=UPI0013D1D66F|nr:hypothetical protein [Bacteroides sp. 51]NDV82924.1 hypothetical protein [Bacteroides sp. 51]
MDAKLLYELKLELDRIYINGIRLARNNPRITRMLPLLEKHTEEDAAYHNLVVHLKALIQPGVSGYVELLSRIYASLKYLLRLHGEAIVAGEEKIEQVPVFNMSDIGVSQHSFLELKPLIDALTGVGKERLEVIRKAREQKLFDDFRVYPYLNRALADNEMEVVELAEDIIRHDLGDKMLSFLLNDFECNDKDDNLRRLTLLCELQYDGLDELLGEIMESNAISLQITIVQYISKDVAYEDRIIELAESSQKLFKEMAYSGLASLKTEKGEKKLYELYIKALKKKNRGDIELLVKALSQTGLQYTFNDVLGQVKDLFNHILIANKKAEADHFSNLRLGISILKVKGRLDIFDFFSEILLHEGYNEIIKKKKNALAKPASALSCAIIDAIQELDTEQAVAFYEKIVHNMVESEWKQPFYKTYLNACVQRGDSEAQIYENFVSHYQNKNINIEDVATLCVIDESGSASASVDNRWVERLYETLERIDEEENIEVLLQVLNALEPVPSERYNRELVRAGEKTRKYLLEITSMIMKRDIADKYEVVYSLVKHCHDQGPSGSNALRQLPRATYWNEFPKEYAAKFRELKNAPRAIYSKIVE